MSDDQLSLASVEFRGDERRWETGLYVCAVVPIVSIFISFITTGALPLIVGGLLASLLFFAFGKASRDFDRSVILAFDQEGLTIPHVFTRKVPWTAVQSYSFAPDRNNGLVLGIGLIEPKLYGPQILIAPNFGVSWPYRRSGISLSLDGVAGGENEVDAAFRRFAPQVMKA